MERTIRFRGKRITDGEWIYGDFFRNRGLAFIAEDGVVENPLASWKDYNVTPDTVGQFTGLHEANGKEIYEGDIIKTMHRDIYHVINYNESRGAFTATLINKYINDTDGMKTECNVERDWLCRTNKIVVGNIHDNPEMLKGGEV